MSGSKELDNEMTEAEVPVEDEAPEDDFFEADASAEVTEDEEDDGEEYETEDEAEVCAYDHRGRITSNTFCRAFNVFLNCYI